MEMNNETNATQYGLTDCPLLSNNCSNIFMESPHDMLRPVNRNPASLPIIVTHAVTFLIGVAGNGVVIATWSFKSKIASPTAIFLVSLAAADLLLLLVFVPLETLEYFGSALDSGGSLCKMKSYVEMLSGMASVLNLVAVSIERFLVIVFPMRARRWCTVSTTSKGLIAVWSLAVILAIPVLFTKTIYPVTYYNNLTSITAYYCWDSNDSLAFWVAVYQLLVMFVVPALFMVICYFLVMQVLWISTQSVNTMTHVNVSVNIKQNTIRMNERTQSFMVCWPTFKHQKHSSSHSLNSSPKNLHNSASDVTRGRKQVIKMLLLIVILFMLCWGPRLVMNVLIKLGLENFSHTVYTARIACYLLSFIHSAINPFVYGLMSSNFRRMVCHPCKREHHLSGNACSSESYHLNRFNTLSSNSTRFANSFV